MSATIKEITSMPEAFGFTFASGPVARGKGDKAVVHNANAPHIRVENLATFDKAFPGVVLDALDGSSIIVQCQAKTRNNDSRDWDTLCALLVTTVLLGAKSARKTVTREIRTLFMPNTQKRIDVTAGVTDDIRAEYAAEMVDLGMPADAALAAAQKLQ